MRLNLSVCCFYYPNKEKMQTSWNLLQFNPHWGLKLLCNWTNRLKRALCVSAADRQLQHHRRRNKTPLNQRWKNTMRHHSLSSMALQFVVMTSWSNSQVSSVTPELLFSVVSLDNIYLITVVTFHMKIQVTNILSRSMIITGLSGCIK